MAAGRNQWWRLQAIRANSLSDPDCSRHMPGHQRGHQRDHGRDIAGTQERTPAGPRPKHRCIMPGYPLGQPKESETGPEQQDMHPAQSLASPDDARDTNTEHDFPNGGEQSMLAFAVCQIVSNVGQIWDGFGQSCGAFSSCWCRLDHCETVSTNIGAVSANSRTVSTKIGVVSAECGPFRQTWGGVDQIECRFDRSRGAFDLCGPFGYHEQTIPHPIGHSVIQFHEPM